VADWRDCLGRRPGQITETDSGRWRLYWQTPRPASPFRHTFTTSHSPSSPVPLSRDESLLFLVPCSSIFLTIFYPQPVPLPRDDSLLFLILCPSLSLRWPTPFPASRGMTSGLLTALCAKEEAARTSTPPFHSFCGHAFAALVFCWMSVMYSAQWRRLSCPCSIASALTGSGGDFTDCSDTSSPQVSLSTHGIPEDRSRLRCKGGSVVLPGGGGSGLGFEDPGPDNGGW
jgi:hypothetical protein